MGEAYASVQADARIQDDLKLVLDELSSVEGLLGLCLELDCGRHVEVGQSIRDFFDSASQEQVRDSVLFILSQAQDVTCLAWDDLRIVVCRIGHRGRLWALCSSHAQEHQVLEVCKQRRKAWALRLDPLSSAEPDSRSEQHGAWRAELTGRIASLLQETQALFVELRSSEAGVDVDAASQEFESLAQEWAMCCDPSVVSIPMLLDSLRQCLGREGELRASFFERMQDIMAGP